MSQVPKPPDQSTAKWNPDAMQLESIVLATIHSCVLCHHKPEVVTMIQHHFVASDVYDCMCELNLSIGAEKPGGRRDTAERSAGK